MDGMDIMKVILMLIGFCSLLFLTYVTTRYIGTKQNKAMKGKRLHIIESISLGADKTIEFLTTLDMEEDFLTEDEIPEGENLFDFREIFDKYISAYKKQKKSEKTQGEDTAAEIPDRNRFKSNLSRLKLIVQKDRYQAKEDGVESTDEK
jgi:flagellar protein FliO/FliZ